MGYGEISRGADASIGPALMLEQANPFGVELRVSLYDLTTAVAGAIVYQQQLPILKRLEKYAVDCFFEEPGRVPERANDRDADQDSWMSRRLILMAKLNNFRLNAFGFERLLQLRESAAVSGRRRDIVAEAEKLLDARLLDRTPDCIRSLSQNHF